MNSIIKRIDCYYWFYILVVFVGVNYSCESRKETFKYSLSKAFINKDTLKFRQLIFAMNDTCLSDEEYLHTRVIDVASETNIPIGIWDSNCGKNLDVDCFKDMSPQYRKRYRNTIRELYVSYSNSNLLFRKFEMKVYNRAVEVQSKYFDEVMKGKIDAEEYVKLILCNVSN